MGKRKIAFLLVLAIILSGLLLPETLVMPVENANAQNYNANSFWFYPWGKSGTHKGVDIFAKQGTPVLSATSGLVLYTGELKMGGKVAIVLGPKWRLHYYAHLDEITTSIFSYKSLGEKIGTVGTTGNAAGKPPHLHYAIVTLFPYFWRADSSPQGWKKIFYLNPIIYLKKR